MITSIIDDTVVKEVHFISIVWSIFVWICIARLAYVNVPKVRMMQWIYFDAFFADDEEVIVRLSIYLIHSFSLC